MWKTLTTRYFIPPGEGSSPIIMGVIIPSVFATIGLLCAFSGQTYFVNRWHHIHNKPGLTWVDGPAAVLGVWFYLCIALWLHFTHYWSEYSRLEKYSPLLSNISLISVLILGCWAALI